MMARTSMHPAAALASSLLLGLLACAPAAPAPASAPADPPHPSTLSGPRRALAAGTALVPGLLVHGTGHFVAGQPRGGWTLLAMEGLGLIGLIGGFGGLAATGAARTYAGPLAAMTAAGAGLFVISAFADLYGVLAPEGGTGSPPLALPWAETELGLRYVYDPVFNYRLFATQGIDLRLGALRLYPSGWFALDDANARVRALAAYRFTGPLTPDRDAPRPHPRPRPSTGADGSYLELQGALTHHRYATEDFAITTGEIALMGRLDLDHIAPTLRGSFAELGGGIGLELHRYFGLAEDTRGLLLMRFGFGIYLGHGPYPRGEAQVYYDHRHDGFAGGLKLTGLGSGAAGHLGAEGRVYLDRQWGLLLDVQAGSAWIGGASLLVRHGGNP